MVVVKPRDRDTFFPHISHVVGEAAGVSLSLQKTIAIDRFDNYLDVIPQWIWASYTFPAT